MADRLAQPRPRLHARGAGAEHECIAGHPHRRRDGAPPNAAPRHRHAVTGYCGLPALGQLGDARFRCASRRGPVADADRGDGGTCLAGAMGDAGDATLPGLGEVNWLDDVLSWGRCSCFGLRSSDDPGASQSVAVFDDVAEAVEEALPASAPARGQSFGDQFRDSVNFLGALPRTCCRCSTCCSRPPPSSFLGLNGFLLGESISPSPPAPPRPGQGEALRRRRGDDLACRC